jgi:TM2 domain-containing membrane protein YozV
MNEKNEISNKYDITILTAYFIGPLGVHRLINKHYITGFILLGLSIISFMSFLFVSTLPIAFVGLLI